MRLYDYLSSGNSYKVRLLLTQLGRAYERIELDIDKGETRTPEFLAINPNGRVPTLVLDSGEVLCESNAILYYLADGTPYFDGEKLARARILQWMFFEQYSHEPYIAVSRYILQHLPPDHPRHATLPDLRTRGYAALDVMEKHLADHPYFAGDDYSIADIALYAYTHVAGEGGFDLANHPAVNAWLERVRGQPGHIPITAG
ncbi:MAG: glutathione S-transferase family protein [Gammaproteobacteria bacterium]|nr:glutathione S-transferase family protein [Gammaproteobacteria bacterium]